MKQLRIICVTVFVLTFLVLTGCVEPVTAPYETYRVTWRPDYAEVAVFPFPDTWGRGVEPIAHMPVYPDWLDYIVEWLEILTFNIVAPVADMTVDLIFARGSELYRFGFDDFGITLWHPNGRFYEALHADYELGEGHFFPIFNIQEMVGEIRLDFYYDNLTPVQVILMDIIGENPELFYVFERLDGEDKTTGLPIDEYYNEAILAALGGLVLVGLSDYIDEYALELQNLRSRDADADVTFVFAWYGDIFYMWSLRLPALTGTFDVSGTRQYLDELIEVIYSFH